MAPFSRVPTRCLALSLAVCASLLTALAAHADMATLLMRVDGVKGEARPQQPLGDDAFALANFSFSTDDTSVKVIEGSADRLGELKFTMPITEPAIALWQLAAQKKEVPKLSVVALDPASGAVRYRVDLEEVVVSSMAFQALPKRDAAVGALTYQRIRIRAGEGDKGTTASWDRKKNAPWK